jgi:putative addiction module component (TIGR02574 family)
MDGSLPIEVVMSIDLSQLLGLPTPEKLRLIDALWDSIEEAPVSPVVLTAEQQDEIRRRDAEMSADPSSCADPADIDRLLKAEDA